MKRLLLSLSFLFYSTVALAQFGGGGISDSDTVRDIFDLGDNDTFVASDTTPDITGSSLWTSSSTGVTITNFDKGGSALSDGEMIIVRSGGATVYDCTSSGLDCGSVDITTASGDMTVWLFDGTNWDLQSFTDVSTDMGSGGGGTNTNASTICAGTTTYLDGEGNCDDIAAVYEDELNDSAGLLGALSDETGTGVAVFGTTPTIATPVLTLGTASSTASGRISYDAGNDRIVVGDGAATDDFYSGAHTSDTNANTVCSGSTTYLDGDGNCDNIGANTGDQTITLTGDVTGSGTGSFAATIQANSVALTTDTTGNYVATVAAGTGITIAEGDSEGATKTVVSTLGTAIDSTEITDNTILEADLKAVDAPADEECLTYESTGGDFEWQACGSGGSSLPVDDTTSIAKGSADATKEVRFEVDGISTGNVRVLTMPDQNIDLTPGTGSFATEAEGTLASASLPRSGGQMTGNVTMSGSQTVDGRDLSVDGTKLDGIEASATADQTGAEIKTAYQAEANAFTDTKNTKLTGIETSATADQSNSEIKTAYEANSDTNEFSDAEQTKLAGIETAAKDDQTITLTGDVTGSGTGSFAATIQANSVALTTDTTGNYVATVAAGSGITVAGSDAEGATKTVTATLGTAIDSAEITDGVILEADLKVVDSPADEECLTYEATGGDFEWQACGGGGGGGEDAFTAESTPGTTPTATGTDAIAIGDGAVAGDDAADLGALAIGARSTATGLNAIAIGENADATGNHCIAIGGHSTDDYSADCTTDKSIVIGYRAKSEGGNHQIAIGAFAVASGTASVAISSTAIASSWGSIAIGEHTDATGANSIAIGAHYSDANSADALSNNAIAIGVNTLADATEAVAIGDSADAGGVGSIAIGDTANASVVDAIAIGRGADAKTNVKPIAIGTFALADGEFAVAIGSGNNVSGSANARGSGAIAIGKDTIASNTAGVAIGVGSDSAGSASIALGQNVRASGTNCIAIGGNSITADSADCSAVDSIALGQHILADDIGEFAFASGEFSVQSDAHRSWYVLRNQTTNATQTELFADASAGDISVGSDCSMSGFIRIVARRTDADGETAHYTIEWTVDNNAGTTALVGAVSVVTVAEDTAAWSVTATADNSNDGINILVTGEASKTIRWVGAADVTYVCG